MSPMAVFCAAPREGIPGRGKTSTIFVGRRCLAG
jgi:hypothetical protein